MKQISELPVFDKRWLAVAPLSIAVGFIFYRWNVPAAWILAAILCAGGCALLTGRELTVHSEVEGFAKALIAMITAVPLITTPPRQLALFILPGLMVAAVTLVMSFAGGFVLARASSGEITQAAPSPRTGGGLPLCCALPVFTPVHGYHYFAADHTIIRSAFAGCCCHAASWRIHVDELGSDDLHRCFRRTGG